MREERRWFWMIPIAAFDDLTVRDAFEVLRYDQARVENNAPAGYCLFSTLVERGPNLDRLRSYHLAPAWLRGPVGVEWGRMQAHEWAREQMKGATT